MSRFKEYLKQQNIELSPKRYFIDAMSAMAQGLFASPSHGTAMTNPRSAWKSFVACFPMSSWRSSSLATPS